MQRCLSLAKLGTGAVAPNPMVGAVLVHEERIIGEGWHQEYGKAHAEVNCILSVKEEDRQFIAKSTLYVSLEPCAHFGKTPPCTDLIIRHKIPKVIIGCGDPFREVNGRGLEKLKAAGLEVETGLLEKECMELNKRFFTFHTAQRPFIILKWAQTADGFLAGSSAERVRISNEYSNMLVHRWRSEEAAIMVGTNTALRDNPELTNRLWPGKSPVRLLIDRNLQLPDSLKVFDGSVRTIVFNLIRDEEKRNLSFIKLDPGKNIIRQIMEVLFRLQLQSVLVEGGASLLCAFIEEKIWDEARVITNKEMQLAHGLSAPRLPMPEKIAAYQLLNDSIKIYKPSN